MNEAIRWLLGLDRIRFDQGVALSVRFATPPAPWIMLVGALVAGAIVLRFYRREGIKRRWRWPLMLLRFGVIMIALLLLSRPVLVLRRHHVEPSLVAVVLDRSSSMARSDVPIGPATAIKPARSASERSSDRLQSRWSAAESAVLRSPGGLLSRVLRPRRTRRAAESNHEPLTAGQDSRGDARAELWAFGVGAQRIGSASGREEIAALGEELDTIGPTQVGTDISGALATVLQQTRGSHLAGIVLISDGRQTTSSSGLQAALAQAQARSVPVHAVSAGSPVRRPDLAVSSVWCEQDVFVFDTVSLHVQLSLEGFDPAVSPSQGAGGVSVELELRDKADDAVLSRKTLTIEKGRTVRRAELQFRPTAVGRKVLQVVAAALPGEENVANNTGQAVVRAHDEKVSVLYVEGVPRFEYRYLKNLLLREATIESSCLLLGATPDFTQEGTRPIRRFPRSVEELDQYQVVILGDVDPRGDWLSPVQASMLVDFVSVGGGGLAFIAGERNMPHRLRRTWLEKLLPVRIAPTFFGRYDRTLAEPFTPKLTAEGLANPIFRFETRPKPDRQLIRSLPGWFWFAQVAGPQPAATVLAVHPSAANAQGPIPLAVLGRYGAGRTFYLGSDDLWRWRQYAGDRYYENVWLQVIRTLARGRKLGPGRRWHFQTDRKQYDLGQSVRIELSDARSGEASGLDEVPVSVRDVFGDLAGRLVLKRAGDDLRDARLYGGDAVSARFVGRFIPQRAGSFTLYPDLPSAASQSLPVSRSITVVARDPEQARVEADEAFLKRLADRSGGSFHRVTDDLSGLAQSIPDRSVDVPDDVEEPLWDTRLLLAMFVGLIVTEWIIRKIVGLV